jgi:hypothetical protein
MVDFVKKRLQVFVSSTFTDLIEERQAAVEAILTAGHIPAGMELFAAGDESQLEVIKQWIDESDIYLLILGGRYGSVEKSSGKSYTQIEYEYAVEKGKPLFACVINDLALDDKVKQYGRAVVELNEPQKLKSFRDLVTSKVVRFWSDTKDIKISTSEKLAELARRSDLVGWVRQEADFSQLAIEISRLSQENAQLRAQVANSESSNDMTLSYENLLSELTRKNLLEHLLLIRDKSLSGHTYWTQNEQDDQSLRELAIYDLSSRGRVGWFLSEAGKKFVARYDYERNKTQAS